MMRVAVASVVIVVLRSVVALAAPPRCEYPRAVAPPVATVAPASCQRASTANAAAIRAEITKRYRPERTGGRADIKLDCDGLGERIVDIVVETGSGHGGTLGLWHAQLRADGNYDLRGIAYQGDSMIRHAVTPPYQLATGIVALPELARARAALTAIVSEVDPPPPPGTIAGFGFTSSSNDFHLLVRMTDEAGRSVENHYTGYESSSDQDHFIPLEVAVQALQPITELPTAAGAASADDLSLFAARFLAAVPHFDDEFYWWVMERYVDLSRFLGDERAIEGLLTRMTVSKPDRSKIDARVHALEALAKITGWDARSNASVERAANAYTAACKPR